MVSHGHLAVNGRRARTPSISVKEGAEITWVPSSTSTTQYEIVQYQAQRRQAPEWLQMDARNMVGRMLRQPERSDMDIRIDDRLIVEFYSR